MRPRLFAKVRQPGASYSCGLSREDYIFCSVEKKGFSFLYLPFFNTGLEGKVSKLGSDYDFDFLTFYRRLLVTCQDVFRDVPEIFKGIDHTPNNAAEVVSCDKFHVLGSGVPLNHECEVDADKVLG